MTETGVKVLIKQTRTVDESLLAVALTDRAALRLTSMNHIPCSLSAIQCRLE
jgi:hypothetical protein